jgi:glycosyltransferase involved in cell wall biosynthesis
MNKHISNKLYIISTSDEPNNVIFGHASFAKAAGFEPVFVFPYRSESKEFGEFYSGYQTVRLNFVFSNKSKYSYLWSLMLLWYYVTCVFLFQAQAKNFLAVDLFGTIACALLKLRGACIHTLVNDNFSARYDVSRRIYYLLRAIESGVFKFISNSCIFPDKSRYMLLGSPAIRRLFYVPNILTDAHAPRYEGSNSDKLVVMFCGWLVGSRGLELLERILENTMDNVEFLLVGSGDDLMLEQLLENKRINYIGHVSRDANISMMAKSDVNMAFYNPRILINRYALPQKIYDSLMIGCPLFVNSEVEMSVSLLEFGTCITAEYFDVQSICQQLNDLAKDKKPLMEMSKAMISYSKQHCNFDQTKLAAVHVYREIIMANY